MERDIERGNCARCEAKYDISKEVMNTIYSIMEKQYNSCLACNYNPNIKIELKRIIQKNLEFIIKKGKPNITNSGWVSDMMEESIRKYWPKPEERKK